MNKIYGFFRDLKYYITKIISSIMEVWMELFPIFMLLSILLFVFKSCPKSCKIKKTQKYNEEKLCQLLPEACGTEPKQLQSLKRKNA